MKGPMITINWRGKGKVRGLAELAEETLREVGVDLKKEDLINKANELKDAYEKARQIKTKDLRTISIFSFDKELELVQHFVKVVI